MKHIPVAKPVIEEDEIRAVVEVLRSGMLAQGKDVEFFEREFASYIGVKHAVAIANGTLALDAALKAVRIKPGDEVITTPFTFIATSNAILYQGARPVFADIDPRTYNLDPHDVLEKITNRTKAIIVVHLYGQPADMKAFREIADDYKLVLVEDCAQAHGAEFQGEKVGSLGDVGVFSFYPTKNMTTGEGGIVTTNSYEVAKKVQLIRDHGQVTKYVHEELGYNYRMTNIAAAIGRVQLKKLEYLNERRIKNANYLTNNLKTIRGIVTPFTDPRVKHVYNQYVIRVEGHYPSRDEVATKLREIGIETAIHYPIPIHHQPLYKCLGYPQNTCPNAVTASKEVLSLPVHPLLAEEDLNYIVEAIRLFTSES